MRRGGRRWLTVTLLACLALGSLGAKFSGHYGRVILNNFSTRAGIPPVGFDHWRHRAMYTCRVCHVDIGFAMEAGLTKVSASTNRSNFHCGACHNGSTTYQDRPIFEACSKSRTLDEDCRRCHVRKDPVDLAKEYSAFVAKFPKRSSGEVDWEAAEEEGLVHLVDFVKGVSIKQPTLKMDKDVSISSQAGWMSDVIFSHSKHSVWNGCEVCHPDIFPSTERGRTKYSMLQIRNGQYCGVCHTKVAFGLGECDRCHTRPVRR